MGALEGSRMINGRFTHYAVAQHHILTTEERSECTKHLGGLWTLPPDRRVSFGFQEYRLQREEYPSLCAQDLGRRLAALTELGGTFEVIDTDVWSPDNHDIDLSSFRNGSFKYFQESQLTARDAEILVLNIRPRLLDTEEPDYTYSANWVREVFIHGYAYVFDKSALMARYEQLSPGGGELGQLFELHVDCQLCSTRQYLTKGLALFHIVWMDVQKFNEETPEPISPRWARNKIPGLKGYSIGSVSYSALYMSEPYKSDGWWTALTMQPLFDSRGKVGETSPAESDFNTTEERSMMITAFRTIHHAMSSALSSWENVANRLEEILVLDSTHDTVLSRDRFLHSENCFWVINVVQPIER
ncbi:hypothetical protein B0O99DRAFT_315692 [Bisporella sp. PMI_857]|nr:hypothetical protein B0O99DRAFT_315692 [Bisporella sp. PMI_857]